MKNSFIKLLFFCFLTSAISLAAFAQPKPKPKPTPNKTPKAAATPVVTESEDEVFEAAKNTAVPAERVPALKSFLEKFPEAKLKVRALELIVSARAQDAENKMKGGDVEGGVALFELAVQEAPTPMSDPLFRAVVSLIPRNLYYLGQRAAAIRIAALVEEKANGNAAQLLALASFHLSIENAADAQRAAEKAVALDTASAAAYEILGLAYRANLQLAEAAAAYEKGLQTNTRLVTSILYLADAKRALGKPEEALVLYKEVLEKQPENLPAQTGVVMALFDAEKRVEAEAQMQNALAANPKNFILLAGAAYWYAAHNDAGKAVDLAQKAIAVEPRYVWAHIALARGLLLQKRAVEAERVMLQASQYGSFPTVTYERATAKYAAGFYDEAAADLEINFTVKDGKLEVSLAGRIPQSGDSFIDILARERAASIYEPLTADAMENAAKLKKLLVFDLKLSEPEAKEGDVIAAADAFIGEKDPMQTYRRLYVAGRLLLKRIAPAKALEFAQAAVPGIEAAADMPGATIAVLADELLSARAAALRQGTTVSVPDIPRPILLSIMRGRVEELSGWALFQQQKTEEAVVRLRRAVSVLPEKSAWWRSSLWKLGTALDAAGKPEEAFEAYSKSFANGPPETIKFAMLQGLCQRLYNTSEGCEERILAAAKADPNAKKAGSSLLKTPPEKKAEPAVKPENGENTGGNGEAETVKPPATPTPQADATPTTEPTPGPPQKMEDETAKPEPSPTPAAAKSEPGAKTEDGKTVYSNPKAQVRVRSLSSGTKSGCQITVNEEKLSLISNGGWGSVTIDLKGEGKLEDIKVYTENPDDLTLELQPGIGRDINRLMYVVRSISDKKGEFKIFVESPCGEKKEVLITVR
jgi:tetratricopeptide (TPR) repeat protein